MTLTSLQRNLLRYGAAAALLALVLSRAETGKIGARLLDVDPLHIAAALGWFNLSQLLVSERARFACRRAGRPLTFGFALRMHYMGMFYNILVPGGVGGDAYRVLHLRRRQALPARTGIRIQLAGRVGGLTAMLLLACALGTMLGFGFALPAAGALAALLAYAFVGMRLLREDASGAIATLGWSLLAQGAALAGVYCLAAGLGLISGFEAYLLLFLAAAVAGMLPITVGGLGIREFAFFYGAHGLALFGGVTADPEFGITLSLAWFFLTLVTSVAGMLAASLAAERKNAGTG